MRKRHMQVLFRLDEQEHARFMARVKKSGLSQQTFAQKAVLDKPIKEQPPADYPKLVREIAACGNNINQIARLANSTGSVHPAAVTEIKKELDKIWAVVKGIGG